MVVRLTKQRIELGAAFRGAVELSADPTARSSGAW